MSRTNPAAESCPSTDAVAARVWKPGGMALEWAQPWVIALAGEELVINQIARDFIRQSSDEDVRLSNKFFHRIGERFNFLNPTRLPDGQWDQAVLNENQAADLLAVDFFSSGSNREAISLEETRARIQPLLKQCRPVVRSPGKPEPEWRRGSPQTPRQHRRRQRLALRDQGQPLAGHRARQRLPRHARHLPGSGLRHERVL